MKAGKLQTMVLLTLFSNVLFALDDSPENRAYQLLELAADQHFAIQGIEQTDLYDFKRVSGSTESQIQQLLSEFNYVMIRTDSGKLERLIILGEKSAGPKQIVVTTQKRGQQHLLSAAIKGLVDEWLNVDFLVDTGAERIVLPYSIMESLGYDAEKLETLKLQTANGIVEAKKGRLEAIEIDHEIIRDVGVAFVQDELLGENKLLGMNVLSRFRFTIDNELQEITFKKKIN